MIFLHTSPEKISLLPSELQSNTDISGGIVNVGILVSRLRNARHYDQIIIDVALLENAPQEIADGLYLLKMQNPTNLTVIVQGTGQEELLSMLVKHEIYNLVVSYTPDRAAEELSECLAGKRSYQDVYWLLPADLAPAPDTDGKQPVRQTVAVVGICPRIGVTTQAVRIARYLQKSCVIEYNDSNCFYTIRDVFQGIQVVSENECIHAGIPLCREQSQVIATKYCSLIYDTGEFQPGALDFYARCDKKVILAGSKAWEILKLPAVRQSLEALSGVSYVFSFTGEDEHDDLLDLMGDSWRNTFFAPYNPDPFSELLPEEKDLYDKLFERPRSSKFAFAGGK